MRIAIWMMVVAAASLAVLPSSFAAPSTRPVLGTTLMARNLGPLGQLVEADAKAKPDRYYWLSNRPAERARIIKDFDAWSVVVIEVVDPESKSFFRDDCDPWVVLRRTGSAAAAGTMEINYNLARSVRAGADPSDHLAITYSWQGTEGHKVMDAAVFSEDVGVTVKRSGLQPTRGQAVELPFTGDVIDLTALPLKLNEPIGNAASLLSMDATHLVLSSNAPDATTVPFTANLDGVLEATAGDARINLRIRKMAAESAGDARHVIGYLRVETTTGDAAAVEHDIAYDIKFTIGADNKPVGGTIRWSWPAGTEGDVDPTSQPTTGPVK
jgi:hypothetical protein